MYFWDHIQHKFGSFSKFISFSVFYNTKNAAKWQKWYKLGKLKGIVELYFVSCSFLTIFLLLGTKIDLWSFSNDALFLLEHYLAGQHQ